MQVVDWNRYPRAVINVTDATVVFSSTVRRRSENETFDRLEAILRVRTLDIFVEISGALEHNMRFDFVKICCGTAKKLQYDSRISKLEE